MITVTRLNGKELVINAELIEFVEATPDTIITLTTNTKIMVKESVDEVVGKVFQYKGKLSPFCWERFGTDWIMLN